MIRNNYFLSLIMLTLSAVSMHAMAKQECKLPVKANPDSAKLYIQCLDSQLNKIKQIQNTWISKQQYELSKIEEESGNTQVLALFERAIANHHKYISSACQWRYLLKLPNATDAAISYKLCEIELISQFTDTIKKTI
ncbi:hypothetical protein V6260_00895 [Pseudoalteromonas aliena]|uniref:hypothetical protein n=1 Tax=Pseudoalteromonas aliena TaxID=247523 RepID=UPI00311FECEE